MINLSLLTAYFYKYHGVTGVKPYITAKIKKRRYFLGYDSYGRKLFIKLDYESGQTSQREAYVLKLLNRRKHNFSPRLAMFDANGKIPFIATEFIPGITLECLLAKKS
jgi:hypothetical protein